MKNSSLVTFLFAGLCASCQSAPAPIAPAAPAPAPAASAPAPAAPAVVAPAAQPAPKPAAQPDFTAEERAMIADLIEKDALAALKESRIPVKDAIVIRPFLNDRNGYVRDLLKTAVTDAGLVCVEASDDMWEDIMKEIGWNQGFRDILDERTMTELGRLLPTQLLLYGKLRIDRTAKGRPTMELALHACDLVTRQHIWGKTLRRPGKLVPGSGPVSGSGPVRIKEDACGTSELSVFVEAIPSDPNAADLAAELLSIARENIGGRGFQISREADDADVTVRLEVSKSTFDRTGESAVMEGGVRAIATVSARNDFFLDETRIDRVRGERQLGDRDAMLSVRDAIAPRLVSWLGQNVTAEKTGLEAIRLVYDVSQLDQAATAKFITDYCRAIGGMKGVCSCRCASTPSDDEAAFVVAFLPKDIPEGVINAGRVDHPELFSAVEMVR